MHARWVYYIVTATTTTSIHDRDEPLNFLIASLSVTNFFFFHLNAFFFLFRLRFLFLFSYISFPVDLFFVSQALAFFFTVGYDSLKLAQNFFSCYWACMRLSSCCHVCLFVFKTFLNFLRDSLPVGKLL